MEELKLSSVSEKVKKIIEPYLKNLVNVHKGNIVSINLYGSATGGDFLHKKSDINLMVILKHLGLSDLKKSLRFVSSGIKKKISAPLFLTLEHIQTSQDVFPIEFLEMKENYLCLYGEDILSGLNIKSDYIRLFCEEQIKGKLIRVRQAYLEIGLRKKGIEALMKESMYSLIPIFRNLLRLKGAVPPIGKENILTAVSDKFELEKGVFTAILKDKKNDEKIAGKDIEVYFEKYLNQIQKLAITVDRL